MKKTSNTYNKGKMLSFVVPCYGSQNSIAGVVEEIKALMIETIDYTYEILLINDYSPDNVFDVIQDLSKDSYIKIINLAKNFGQHSALMAGYNYAQGDIIISVDDDGQIPVEDTFKLVEKIEDGSDVVYANYPSSERGIFRNIGSKINDIMACYMLNKPKNIQITSFFAMRQFIAKEMLKYKNPYPYLGGLIFRSTKNIASVQVVLRPRTIGESGYSLKKLLSLWLNGFTAFSIKPLRFATLVGFIVAVFGAVFGGYTIINRFTNPEVPMGYSSTMAALLFIGGVIMLMLGLIGEYIGRIYISINNSPQYVIKETINIDDEREIP